jgi:hypothetical protein
MSDQPTEPDALANAIARDEYDIRRRHAEVVDDQAVVTAATIITRPDGTTERQELTAANITVSSADTGLRVHRTNGVPPLFAGFVEEWMTGDATDGPVDVTFQLNRAMLTPYLTLRIEAADGRKVYEYIDLSEWLDRHVKDIVTELGATAPGPATGDRA